MDPGPWWPDGDAGPGRIPLSALEHADYCLRQAALIHVDGTSTDDARTVSGTLAHQTVHELKNPLPRSESSTRIVTGVPVWSDRLGLYGICDAVEVSPSGATPVEHKIGRYVPGGPADVQAAAQAMCLEEMLGAVVTTGWIFSHADRRRHRVDVSAALRSRVEELTATVSIVLGASRLPEPVNEAALRQAAAACAEAIGQIPSTRSWAPKGTPHGSTWSPGSTYCPRTRRSLHPASGLVARPPIR